ncbi:MAG: RNA polymerase subunit sigma-70 [Proteobacteria bacterium]|nr:RNA polymerase subunit sigma-70 [Pseudomonadota bacterium]
MTNEGMQVTRLLESLRGDARAADLLFPIVYAQLHKLAQRQLAIAAGATLTPTELVHETYIKLCNGNLSEAIDRRHFFAIGAKAMRQVLVSRARQRNADKRDGGERVTLTPDLPVAARASAVVDVIALDEALNALAAEDARKARAIELRTFGGLEFDDIADMLGISRATLARDYRAAQAWLRVALDLPGPA